jgi:transcriptional regulator with XRE-family HTH domain
MSDFGPALKKARKNANKKLRDIADHLGKSVGYISDIEQKRKAPPDLETVAELQKFLQIEDNHLIELATEARIKRPSEVVQKIQERPRLSELYFRVKDMSDEDLADLLGKIDS